MEKHKCKLCFKNFSNGRALGGHMRSHMLNLPIPQKQRQEQESDHHHHHHQLSFEIETESASTSEDDESNEEKSLFYGLGENPKRSIRLVDPEFDAAAAASASASVVLQDRESETESSKNPTRRRSKRSRKLEHRQELDIIKKLNFNNKNKTNIESSSWGHEPEPVSSISDTTTEEDVAFCLMMLSRDKWKRKEKRQQQQQQIELMFYEDDEEEEANESEEFKSSNKNRSSRGKYNCETCKKTFKSYQALGGHRASHKKIKIFTPVQETELDQENAGAFTYPATMLDKKVHECPVCFRVFSSGQALGGHKRTHVTGLAAAAGSTSARSASASTKLGEKLIDLNLPAPIDDDDDISQIELSAVSDAEFVNHIKR